MDKSGFLEKIADCYMKVGYGNLMEISIFSIFCPDKIQNLVASGLFERILCFITQKSKTMLMANMCVFIFDHQITLEISLFGGR